MFKSTLSSTFLENLIPLKSPPTMMSSTNLSSGLNSSTNSSSSPTPTTPLTLPTVPIYNTYTFFVKYLVE